MRSLGLAGDVLVYQAFSDIEALAASCRFSDCRHQTEPGCVVAVAASSGELDRGRLASYRKLQREAAADARRSEPLLRRAEPSVWKARAKSARLDRKRRPR